MCLSSHDGGQTVVCRGSILLFSRVLCDSKWRPHTAQWLLRPPFALPYWGASCPRRPSSVRVRRPSIRSSVRPSVRLSASVPTDLDNFSAFVYVFFAGDPICADIYFAHVYRTNRGAVSRLREVSTWRSLQSDLTLALLCCCEPQRYTSNEGQPPRLRRLVDTAIPIPSGDGSVSVCVGEPGLTNILGRLLFRRADWRFW